MNNYYKQKKMYEVLNEKRKERKAAQEFTKILKDFSEKSKEYKKGLTFKI